MTQRSDILSRPMLLQRLILTLLVSILFETASGQPVDTVVIHGVFADDNNNPVAGALVALYRADNDLLIDETFTSDRGSFMLRGVKGISEYYVVGTKDTTSQRVGFTYSDAGRQLPIRIPYHISSSWGTRVKNLWVYISLPLGTLLGFISAIALRRLDNQRLLKSQLRKLRICSTKVATRHLGLVAIIDESLRTPSDRQAAIETLKERYQLIIEEIEELLPEIESNKLDTSLIYFILGERGLDQQDNLWSAVRGIRKLTRIRFESIVNERAEVRQRIFEPFTSLASNELLQK